MNDKSANFPAIYYNVLKHEWNLSVTWRPSIFHLIDRFSACWSGLALASANPNARSWCGAPLSSGADGYAKTPNERKILRKTRKDNTVLKTYW